MISQRYRRTADLYRHFAESWADILDFSEEALEEFYAHESTGAPMRRLDNGYEQGKKWLDVHVATWAADLCAGLLTKSELYADPALPNWWLDRWVPRIVLPPAQIAWRAGLLRRSV